MARIIDDAGKKTVKALVIRLQECERRLVELRRELVETRSRSSLPAEPLQLADIEAVLGDLRELLRAETPVVAPVLRMLTGPIVVEQVPSEGKKRPIWLAKFELNAVPVLVEILKKRKVQWHKLWIS